MLRYFLFTAMVVQIYIILHAPLYSIIWSRIIENTIGAAIGAFVAVIIFPVNSKKALNRGLNIFSVNLRKKN